MRSGQGTDTYVDDTWYDAAGRVTMRELGTNYTLGQTYTYYPWTQQGGRLHSLQSGLPLDQDSLQSLSYVYDEVGNVLSITDYNAGGTQTQTFIYDDLNRLSSAVASGGTGGTYALQDYDYDTQGRLEINGTVTNYYENTAHIHAVSKTSTGNTYSYDQNGNQNLRKVSGITYTLVYDAESRLVQIKRGSNIQATYSYDGDGNRVKTVVGSTTTTYIGNYLERECINTTCALKRYYYAAGQRVALRKGDGTLYFLLTDHLGSTAVTATSGGGLYGELRYYPWGGTRYDSGTTPTSYRYTGQREAEVGLYYYGARYYDPYLNRWIQPDSVIPEATQGVLAWDRFSYVNNNPLIYADPDGHFAFLVPILAGSVIGGVISTVTYAITATATGHDVTLAGAVGAFVGGAITGAVSVVATPLAGSLLHAAGVAASGTALVAGTAAVNAVGGAVSYLAAGGTQNAVDLASGNSPTFQPTIGGALFNAGVAGYLSPIVGSTFPVATNTMGTISQASHFIPGRTVTSLLATQNARNMYAQALVATGMGMFAGLHYEEPE